MTEVLGSLIICALFIFLWSKVRQPAVASKKQEHAPINRVGKPYPSNPKESSARTSTQNNSTASKTPVVAPEMDWKMMGDDEIVRCGSNGGLALYSLEKVLQDPVRAVQIRRRMVSEHFATQATSKGLAQSLLPFENYDYARVHGSCCENVVGVLPLPLGVAGPLNLDGQFLFLPMATTEGVLVASTNRGCNAINASGGVTTSLLDDGMTRGPALRFPSLERATAAKRWLESSTGYHMILKTFNGTSRFASLRSIKVTVVGSDVFVRFKSTTGDAMGMNMISKGVESALAAIAGSGFEDMHVLSLSGNYCTDKKSAAVNWIDGRGKSVCAQAVIGAKTLQRVLKIDVDTLVELNTSKNLVGSAVAGAMGGFNAHAANIVTAIFLATGQDPAQNVESSACLTTMKKTAAGDLEISVTMPSVEVGTVGGGTVLEPQKAMLDLLGVKGANADAPGANAQRLACVIAGAVLAGELSLLSSLAAGSLVGSHMAHNRAGG